MVNSEFDGVATDGGVRAKNVTSTPRCTQRERISLACSSEPPASGSPGARQDNTATRRPSYTVDSMRVTGERPVHDHTPASLIALHVAGYELISERIGSGVGLDIGCGIGTESRLLSRADRTVIGLDYDIGTAGLAQAVIDGAVCGDARQLPFQTNSLDWVSSSHIIEHFTDPERHVAEIARVLRPGGRLVVLTPNAPADFENPFHVHLFSLNMFGELLNKYFDVVEINGLTGNAETMKTFDQRRRAGRRLLALDPFGLRHHLPVRALAGLHSVGRRVVYPLLRSADESITAGDFEVIERSESISDSTLVLVGTATAT